MSSTCFKSDWDIVREIVLAETVVSCGGITAVVKVLAVTVVAAGLISVLFSVF